ncbi:Guanine nucleotide exchange factor DBS [Oryzias melastigma]|uniref:Guanine nucleotide exchange factor DBS n=1 Tax=Oryzias melastigma TaxID=30732 RepID=A0A834BSM2_ORYME|nr:Guanine nucleotide exchange factor DBS [Oryzias melastigma]
MQRADRAKRAFLTERQLSKYYLHGGSEKTLSPKDQQKESFLVRKALSPEQTAKRHSVKSDPTPFGFREPAPHITLTRVKWMSTTNLVQRKRQGWSKASLSVDASEENDGYSSGEDPMNSDTEEDGVKKLAPGKYTVVADCEKAGPQELSVKSGDMVQLIREGEEGQW